MFTGDGCWALYDCNTIMNNFVTVSHVILLKYDFNLK